MKLLARPHLLATFAVVIVAGCAPPTSGSSPSASPSTTQPATPRIAPLERSVAPGPCAELDYCACADNPRCQPRFTKDGCVCSCDFQCHGEPGCMCACGGARFAACEPRDATPTAAAASSPPPAAALSHAQPVVATAPAPFCDDQKSNPPCVFMSQGKCFLDAAPKTTWKEQPCPTPPPPLSGDACRRADMCRGVSDEGCCIGCSDIMSTSITATCARKIEAAPTCAGVTAALRTKGCTLH